MTRRTTAHVIDDGAAVVVARSGGSPPASLARARPRLAAVAPARCMPALVYRSAIDLPARLGVVPGGRAPQTPARRQIVETRKNRGKKSRKISTVASHTARHMI